MVIRRNHYDAAFEAYLRAQKIPYVAVDEKRRALAKDASIKSLDFIVYASQGPNLLIDVKGRTEISPNQNQSRRWKIYKGFSSGRSCLEMTLSLALFSLISSLKTRSPTVWRSYLNFGEISMRSIWSKSMNIDEK